MTNKNFQYSFTTTKNADEVFMHLVDPRNWWVGIFNETIKGKSEYLNDEFSFRAGDGVHFSNQKLVELMVPKKLVWLVTESNLSFLKNTNEWAGTKICFDIEKEGDEIRVTFTHYGLIPLIECYGNCSSAWTQYMQNLQESLK
jgi:hypothetical protein